MVQVKPKKRIYIFAVAVLFLIAVLFLGRTVIVKAASDEGFIYNEETKEYEIWDGNGFAEFRSKVFDGTTFEDQTVHLKEDITFTVTEAVEDFQIFNGEFNGDGHTIKYNVDDFLEGKEVFPFYMNGKVNNLKVDVKGSIKTEKIEKNTQDEQKIDAALIMHSTSLGTLEGIEVTGGFDINICKETASGADADEITIDFSIFDTWRNTVRDCSSGVNYEINIDNEILEKKNIISLVISDFGNGSQVKNVKYINCFSYGSCNEKFIQKVEGYALNKWSQVAIVAFIKNDLDTGTSFNNCYYDKNLKPEIYAAGSKRINDNEDIKEINKPFARTTEQMKSKDTYQGFDFEKYWDISNDKNNGYPYYSPREVVITLDVKPVVTESKVWNTSTPKDQNKYATTDTYYYPYKGDNTVNVDSFTFTDLTEKQRSMIDKYGITVSFEKDDIESATVNMDYLGQRPVTVKWKDGKSVVLNIQDADQAKADKYVFKVNVVQGTCEVVDNGDPVAHDEEWYYQKSQEAIKLILKSGTYGLDKSEGPSWANSDIWFVFTAARCHYDPITGEFNDKTTYFDQWFANTKEYLQTKKNEGKTLKQAAGKITELAKMVLAIEAMGYDPRDIESYDLLEGLADRAWIKQNGGDLTEEYAIQALKNAGYSSANENNLTNAYMDQWAHEKADGIQKTLTTSGMDNADAYMSWQTLIYWYKQEGFEDVTVAIEKTFETQYFPMQWQRSTGACCTIAYENPQPPQVSGNNAWNNAQAMLYISGYGRSLVDKADGFVKNGNTILDATFDLINFEKGTIPGFYWYDPAQIARALNGFAREYKNEAPFWVFSDVIVPTKAVNDAILALNDQSTADDIKAARAAYDALDETHKKIFNAETLRKLLKAENPSESAVEDTIRAIEAIPAADTLTTGDKATVEKARAAYDKLTDEQKLAVSDYYEILRAAEQKLQALENDKDKIAADKVIAAIEALPLADEITVDSYESVQYTLNRVQAQYDALTDAQKALVSNYSTLQYLQSMISDLRTSAAVVKKIRAIGTLTSENYEKKQAAVIEARTAYDALTAAQKKYVTNYSDLEQAELFLNKQNKDAKVVYVISFLDELYLTTKEDGSYTDGPLKLTEKANKVPTEKIWGDWESYVADARTLFDALTQEQQAQVTNVKYLTQAEAYIYQLRSDALVKMLKELPDAATVHGQETAEPTATPQPTEAAAQDVAQAEELMQTEQAQAAETGFGFSDGSEDVFTEDTFTAEAVQTEEMPAEEVQETPAQTEEVVGAAEFVSEEEAPEAQAQTTRALTDSELTKIAEAKHAYDQLAADVQVKFRGENTALVENLEKLVAMALTYEKGQSEYQKLFAAEAAEVYAAVKDDPVDRDSYPSVKAFLDRYAKDYEAYQSAMAGLKVKVGDHEMTFAEVIAALTAQAETAAKDISDAEQADEWIMNLPTAVTKDNIKSVEAELAGLSKFMNSMTAEGKSYMWNAKQLELVKTIVADYHIELAGMQEVFKAAMPTGLQTDVLNYKTIQIRWNGVENADGYIVYRRTEDGEWQKLASDVTGVSYKDTTALTGVTYYYTVSAYSYVWGSFTESQHHPDGACDATSLGKTKIATAVSNNYKSIRITWNKVSGANGYRICRSTTKNGKYTCIGTTKKNSAVSFLDKTAVTGQVYYYKVRAYRNVEGEKVYGASSAAAKAKAVPGTPTLTVGSTGKTAVLEWTKVKGADGYQVYRSTSKNGKFTRVKTTKDTGFTNEKLATGKNFYYKVRAYKVVDGKKVYSSFSTVKKITIK